MLGISGSPVNNSNTDRLVKIVLEATGLDYEFIKLSEYDIHPCRYGGTCMISGVPLLFGQGAVPSRDKYTAIEDQL